MKKMLVFGLTAVVLFGLSATASWFLRQQKKPQGEHEAAHGEPAPADAEAPHKSSMDGLAEFSAAGTGRERPAARPPFTVGAEEAVQLANSLRDRLGSVREREARLAARQKQFELIYKDIQAERGAIDELRKQVSAEGKAVESQLTALEQKHAELEQQQQKTTTQLSDLEKNVVQLEGLEQGNLKKIADMYDSMAPESAAKILQQLAETGKMDTAVKMLGLMKERQAAKVLAELSDPALAAQLLDKLKDLKRPAKK